jgi:hypothetical protein
LLESATVIGCDIGKLVVHVHGINTDGKMIMRRQPKRRNLLSFFQNQRRLSVSNCVSSDDHLTTEGAQPHALWSLHCARS